jgi:ribonuclease HI
MKVLIEKLRESLKSSNSELTFDSNLEESLKQLSKNINNSINDKNINIFLSSLIDFFEQSSLSEKIESKEPVQFENVSKYIIYTDGACRGNPGPGGYGFVILDQDLNILKEQNGYYENTTNNQMELMAARKALSYLKEQNQSKYNKLNILLVSDSKYVLDGLKSWLQGWKKRGWKKSDKSAPENLELWKQLDELTSNLCNISYQWVKGHSGEKYNERCDELANEAIDGKYK